MIFDDREYIARKIRLARKKANLTQEELAEKIGISAKQISRIEIATYSPSLSTFLKLISILNIDISEFGIQNSEIKTDNSNREKLIKLIYNATDSEIEFYYVTLDTMAKNINIIKEEKMKV